MVTQELTVAVIGCGRMGAATPDHVRADLSPGWWPLNHADAASNVPGLKLVAFCDVNEAAAAAAAARHGGEAYADFRTMVERHRPDIVTIATRTEGRADMISELCERGVRGMHAEKPLCRSLREGEKAAMAVASSGVTFTYGATRRHMDVYRHARDLVSTGEFGAIKQVHVHLGPATLQWSHPHAVDIAMFFLADEAPVSASAHFAEPLTADGNTLDADPRLLAGFLRFSNGVSALISAARGCDVVIACERGNISILADGETIEVRRPASDASGYFRAVETVVVKSERSGTEAALTKIRDALRGSQPADGGMDVALPGQRALFAMALSGLRNGAEVALTDVPLDFTVTGRQGTLHA